MPISSHVDEKASPQMNTKEKSLHVQFCKRLTIAILVLWVIQRVAALVCMAVRPDYGEVFNQFLSGTDDLMMFTVGCYTGNSVAEKGIIRYFDSRAALNGACEQENG